jgi:hypothetical protein
LNVLQDFGLEGESAIHAVRSFRSMMHGFASLEQKEGFGLLLDLDITLQLLTESFLFGLSVYQKKD